MWGISTVAQKAADTGGPVLDHLQAVRTVLMGRSEYEAVKAGAGDRNHLLELCKGRGPARSPLDRGADS